MKLWQSRQSGIALIAVLWLVAAMSLITAGIVQSVKGEVRTVGLQRQVVSANAAGDAAILLALQSMHVQPQGAVSAYQKVPSMFEGVQYEVLVQSLNGRIDLNNASITLLADLYTYGAGLSTQAAQLLAQNTVDTRQTKSPKGVKRDFHATEDLLAVPQMTYDLYARLENLITADVRGGSGRVNPVAAPDGVLRILLDGNAARAGDLAAKRDADPNLMDTSVLKPAYIDTATSTSFRLQVSVALGQGESVQRVWHVYWSTEPRTGLPWRVLSTSSQIIQAGQS